MGSSYFGEPDMRSEHGTRKSKKSGQSDKPKQPQRGLGVAQLEKIRLHTQIGGSISYNHLHSPTYPPAIFTQIGVADYERGNIRYSDSQPSNPTSGGNANGFLETPPYMQPAMTRHLFNIHVEDPQTEMVKNHRCRLLGSNSQSSEANDVAAQEVDLELRLSL